MRLRGGSASKEPKRCGVERLREGGESPVESKDKRGGVEVVNDPG